MNAIKTRNPNRRFFLICFVLICTGTMTMMCLIIKDEDVSTTAKLWQHTPDKCLITLWSFLYYFGSISIFRRKNMPVTHENFCLRVAEFLNQRMRHEGKQTVN